MTQVLEAPPTTEEKKGLTPPSKPGEWSIDQIIKALSRPIPETLLGSKRQGGTTLVFIPWYEVNRILDKYAPGWSWEVRQVTHTDKYVFLVGRLTIPTSNGDVYREATGQELLDCSSYGDPTSNSESMAFRRCAARFGLGLYLYDKD